MVATTITVTGIPEARSALTRIQEGAEAAGRTSLRVGASAKYARFVEEGTRRMRAQPYLRPALVEVEGTLRARLVAALPRGAQPVTAALLGVANTLKAAAEKRVPVRTGSLRSSLYVSTGGGGGSGRRA